MNYAISGVLGANFRQTTVRPDFALGQSALGTDETTWVYARADVAVSAGATELTLDSNFHITAATGGTYTAETAFLVGDYGWLSGAPLGSESGPLYWINLTPATTSRLKAGFDAMQAGTRDMVIAWTGSSVDRGVDETAVPYNSQYPLSVAEQQAILYRAAGIAPFDSGSVGNTANQQAYIDAVIASCVAKGCAAFNLRAAPGWTSKAASDAAGYTVASDAIHKTIAGQASTAALLMPGMRYAMGI